MSGTQTMVILIVLIIAGARLMRARYEAQAALRNAPSDHQQQLASSNEAELQREVKDLRERIKVLERIATDDRRGNAIAAEIESLRDN